MRESLTERLARDSEFCDPRAAGQWLWGMASSIQGFSSSWKKPTPHLTSRQGVKKKSKEGQVPEWMRALRHRLMHVRILCNDWSRVCTPAITSGIGLTALLLDPPYSLATGRDPHLYAVESLTAADECREWCLANGDNPKLRIALCGYAGGHEILGSHGWDPYRWTAQGGLAHLGNGKGKENRKREVIWFSPHCLSARLGPLFD